MIGLSIITNTSVGSVQLKPITPFHQRPMKILQCTECGKDVEMTYEFAGKYAGRAKSTICSDCSLAKASPEELWWKEFHEKNRELLRERGLI